MASKPRVKSKRAMLPAVGARYVGKHVGNPKQQKSWENIFGIKYPPLRFLLQNWKFHQWMDDSATKIVVLETYSTSKFKLVVEWFQEKRLVASPKLLGVCALGKISDTKHTGQGNKLTPNVRSCQRIGPSSQNWWIDFEEIWESRIKKDLNRYNYIRIIRSNFTLLSLSANMASGLPMFRHVQPYQLQPKAPIARRWLAIAWHVVVHRKCPWRHWLHSSCLV